MKYENLLVPHPHSSLYLSRLSPLSPSSSDLPTSNPAPKFDMTKNDSLEFYMGHQKIIATNSDRIDPYRTVYRLTLKKSWIFNYLPILKSLVKLFPSLKTNHPEWFLPSTVILKKRKPGWDKEFETEKRMYCYLEPLQGTFIPHFYGEATYDGSPAFVLEEIRGERLCDLTARPEDDDCILERKLEEAFKALTSYGVIHGDPKLHNIFEVDNRVMIIDFEHAELGSKSWEGNPNKGNVGSLMWDFQACRGGMKFILESSKREMLEMMQRAVSNPQTDFDVELSAD